MDDLIAFVSARLDEQTLEVRKITDSMRAVLIWYANAVDAATTFKEKLGTGTHMAAAAESYLNVIKANATIWNSHPDYRDKWAPPAPYPGLSGAQYADTRALLDGRRLHDPDGPGRCVGGVDVADSAAAGEPPAVAAGQLLGAGDVGVQERV
jgi:hypothetical protein